LIWDRKRPTGEAMALGIENPDQLFLELEPANMEAAWKN
jgi:hypothetical protein